MNLDDTLQVEKNVKQSGSSFYWGMKLLPKEKRRGMFAIYAFCREVDDIADDLKNSQIIKKKKLNQWKKDIGRIFKSSSLDNSLKRELNYSIIKFKLENKFNLINGVYQELAKQVELSKIQVTKDTPVFTILKNADVPTKKHKPKRSLITILFTLVGIIYSFGFLFFKKYGFNL